MTWQARKRAWERERLDPVRARSPERSPRFTTISDVEVARLYGPWDWVPSNGGPGAGGATATGMTGQGATSRRGRPHRGRPSR